MDRAHAREESRFGGGFSGARMAADEASLTSGGVARVALGIRRGYIVYVRRGRGFFECVAVVWLLSFRFRWFEEGSGYCGKCLRQSAVGRSAVNHMPHLLLTMVTFGVWAIFWIRDARRGGEWKCLECGATVYRLMSSR